MARYMDPSEMTLGDFLKGAGAREMTSHVTRMLDRGHGREVIAVGDGIDHVDIAVPEKRVFRYRGSYEVLGK